MQHRWPSRQARATVSFRRRRFCHHRHGRTRSVVGPCKDERSCYFDLVSKGMQTRLAILSHAIEVAGRLGLDSLTIGSLASELSMSKSGLFAHFKSKEQLQLQVLQEAVSRFIIHVIGPAIKKPRGEPRVTSLFMRWLSWSQKQAGGCLIHSASSELDDKPGLLRDFFVRVASRAAQHHQARGTHRHRRRALSCRSRRRPVRIRLFVDRVRLSLRSADASGSQGPNPRGDELRSLAREVSRLGGQL